MQGRGLVLVLVSLMSACAEPNPPMAPPASKAGSPYGSLEPRDPVPPRFPKTFTLSLVRQSMVAKECRMDIARADAGAAATLTCQYPGYGDTMRTLSVRRELDSAESARVAGLAEAAKLFDGGHVGIDGSSLDAVFDRLELRGDRGECVILVTSGNPTFHDGPRRELLDAVLAVWHRLRDLKQTGPG
jgi:hypothetical protein